MTAREGRKRLIVLIGCSMFCFGLVMVASASSGNTLLQGYGSWVFLQRQLAFGAIGLVAMFMAMRIRLSLLQRMARPLLWMTGLLLIAVTLPGLGHSVNGASRWIRIGSFQLQPSELLKLALLILVADHLSRHPPPTHWMRDFIRSPGGVALAFAGLLVAVQSDLGSALVVGAVTLVLYVLAGTRLKLLAGTVLPALALVVLSIVTEDYRRERFTAFRDPWADPSGPGYQLVQALIAIGSGGPFGVGLGHSVQKIHFLPEAHTDMIFAITVEELGIFGVVMVLGSFAILAAVGSRIALRARSRFSALLAAGLTAMIVGQAAVNIAGVVGVMPLTGVPLPLVSYGGSSLIMTLTALGLLANIAVESRPARAELIEHSEPERSEPPEPPEPPNDYLDIPDDDLRITADAIDSHEPEAAGADRSRRHRRPSGTGARSR